MRRYASLKIKIDEQSTADLRQRMEAARQRVVRSGVLSRGGKRIPLRKGYFYNVTTGLRGDIFDEDGQIRGNDNGDFFEWKDELLAKKTKGRHAGKYTYSTWINCPVLENHNPENERGFVADAIPIWDDKGIDMVMATDMNRFADLCQKIERGEQTDVSMGCDLAWSICSGCAHISFTDDDWCDCLQMYKGRRDPRTGRRIAEILKDISGVELSHITEGCGADPAAKNKNILFRPDLCRRSAKKESERLQQYYRLLLGVVK